MLGSLVVQVERAARAQARVDEREERGAELTRVKEERLREQARLLAAYQAPTLTLTLTLTLILTLTLTLMTALPLTPTRCAWRARCGPTYI